MHGIELLLANCDQLTSLMNLTYFEGIKEEKLQQFEQKIKAQNLNLQLKEQNTNIYDVSDSNFMNYKLKDKYPAFDKALILNYPNYWYQSRKLFEDVTTVDWDEDLYCCVWSRNASD